MKYPKKLKKHSNHQYGFIIKIHSLKEQKMLLQIKMLFIEDAIRFLEI